jgi:arylsulfatase A-like enzyme
VLNQRPNTCAPLAEILKLNGYSTAQFGKCHEVPVFESSRMGPFHHWPEGGCQRKGGSQRGLSG